jgi:hypothetical protein
MKTNNDEKLEIMYDTWSNMFVSKKEKPSKTPKWLSNPPVLTNKVTIDEFSMANLDKILNKMKAGTSPGITKMAPELLRQLPKEDKEVMLKLLKFCWKYKSIPEVWKICAIILLEKDPRCNFLPEAYRPIALCNTMYKVYTSILNEKLREHIEANGFLSPSQYGFAKGKSTVEPVITLINVLEDAIKKGPVPKPVYVAFVDLKKAYDSIEHWLIIDSLKFYRVDPELGQAIMSCYQGCKAFLKTPIGNTECFPILRGVRQGDVLSPLLFNIAMNPIYEHIRNKFTGYQFNDLVKVNILAFVDDIALIAKSKEELSEMINELDKFCIYSGMEINAKKTE